MSAALRAQICQIGGAVYRDIVSKQEVSELLMIGLAAAGGDNEAIEVQAAFESGGVPEPEKIAAVLKREKDKLAPKQVVDPTKSPLQNPLKS